MKQVHTHTLIAGLIAAAFSPLAAAQAITFDVLNTSIPTLGDYGVYILATLMAAAGYWVFRKGRGGRLAGMLLVTIAAGVAGFANDRDLIGQASAVQIQNLNATSSGSVTISNPPGVFSLTNTNSSPIRITALVNGGDCSLTPGDQPWLIIDPAGPFVPWCNTGVQVAPGQKCYVLVTCSEVPEV